MTTRDELKAALEQWGAHDVNDQPDWTNSVSSVVLRCRFQGRRTVAVGSDASTEQCIGAVLDLLDLHLAEGVRYAAAAVAADEVSVILGERSDTEALDAIGTLIAALDGGPAIHVYGADAAGVRPLPGLAAADFASSAKAERYLHLMERLDDGPPELLQKVQQNVGRPELRAYPMLTGHPAWSLRLEGLEVGRIRPGRGWLDVGRVGRTGKESEARQVWRAAVGEAPEGTRLTVTSDDGASVDRAIATLSAFAPDWLGEPVSDGDVRQNEHALESRILRGTCPVQASTGALDLLRPNDGITSWGSQFPTRWGHTTSNAARYLDALMRQGTVPWAVEMKVRGAGGVGGYYRHAVGQAVLYRHWIRSATALDPWFTRQGLDRAAARAAVVVPDLDTQPQWRARLQAICDLTEVELIEVPHRYAALR